MKHLMSLSIALITVSTSAPAQTPNYVPTNGLVAWYPFNGNANDESSNTNDGTVNGAMLTTDRFGNTDAAYSFDGVNDLIDCGNISALNGIPEMTISAWFRSSGNVFYSRIIGKELDQDNMEGFTIQYSTNSGDNLRFNMRNGVDAQGDNSTVAIAENQWYNVVMVYNGNETTDADKLRMFINGVQVNLGFSNTIPSTTSTNAYPLWIGNIYGAPTESPWHGEIDDIGIWNRVLTEQEIDDMYSGETGECLPTYVPTNDLVAFYPFCGNAIDESGHGYNGTVYGASLIADRLGNPNSAYSLDGLSNYIELGDLPLGTAFQPMTISMWWQNTTTSNSGNSTLLSDYDGPSGGDFDFAFNASFNYDNDQITVLRRSNPYDIQVQTEPIAGSDWHHFAMVYDGISNIYYYEDGEAIDSLITWNGIVNGELVVPTYDASRNYYSNPVWRVGCNRWSGSLQEFFEGNVDDLGIWSTALSPCEITQIYQGQLVTLDATVTMSGNTTFCQGGEVELTAPAGYDYLWSTNETTQSIVVNSTGTYSVEVSNGNCSSTSSDVNVTVLINPAVSLPSYSDLCIDSAPVSLSGGSPTGGSYTLNGNSATQLDPSQTGTGSQTIVYSYTDQNNCTGTATETVTVNALPNVTLASFSDLCENDSPITLSGGSPTGGSYTLNGNSATQIDPSQTGTGSQAIVYSYTDQNSCSASATESLNVNEAPSPTISTSGAISFCQGGEVELTSSFAQSYDWSTNESTQSITVNSTGSYSVTVTGANNCTGTSPMVNVTVLSNPSVSLSAFSALCENASAITLSGGSPSGGTYTVNGNPTTELDPSLTGTGMQTIEYSYTDQNNCTGSASQTVMVNGIPNVTLNGLNTSYTLSDNPSVLSGTPSGGFFNGAGVANGTFDPAVAGVGTHGVSYAVVDGNGCVGVSSLCTTVDLNVGIDGGNQISNGGGLDIYPNPSNGQFILSVEDLKGPVTYTVYDARGHEVINGSFVSTGNYQETINLRTSADGVYTIQVNSPEGITTRKLIKK